LENILLKKPTFYDLGYVKVFDRVVGSGTPYLSSSAKRPFLVVDLYVGSSSSSI
jgi:hypothetical protein